MRQLAMNCCEGCGLYCNSSSGSCQTLTIERSQLNFCGPTCIGTYKQVCVCGKNMYLFMNDMGMSAILPMSAYWLLQMAIGDN